MAMASEGRGEEEAAADGGGVWVWWPSSGVVSKHLIVCVGRTVQLFTFKARPHPSMASHHTPASARWLGGREGGPCI